MKKIVILAAGLLWGDEDKGATMDWLARYLQSQNQSLRAIIRTNGGSQAAHNVVTIDGKHHTFRQVGSASFTPGVLSYLSAFMLVDPIYLLDEMLALKAKGVNDIFSRVIIDRNAYIITPIQVAANRLRELARGDKRHGSCGQGVGETQSDINNYGHELCLTIGELNDSEVTRQKLKKLLELKKTELTEIIQKFRNSPDTEIQEILKTFTDSTLLDSYLDLYKALANFVQIVDTNWLKSFLAKPGFVAFENSQGVLLDPIYGFVPHVTWTRTTFENAEKLLDQCEFDGKKIKLGLLRAYAHRHGAGPFPSFNADLTALFPDIHNHTNPWQGNFRVGYFDPIMVRYALEAIGGVDLLGIGHLDELERFLKWKMVHDYSIPADLAAKIQVEKTKDQITAVKPISSASEKYQIDLTAALNQAVPRYDSFAKDLGINRYLKVVENRFNIPIGLTANGPTASDRQLSDTFKQMLS